MTRVRSFPAEGRAISDPSGLKTGDLRAPFETVTRGSKVEVSKSSGDVVLDGQRLAVRAERDTDGPAPGIASVEDSDRCGLAENRGKPGGQYCDGA